MLSSVRIAPEANPGDPTNYPAPVGEPLPPVLLTTNGDLARELRRSHKTIARLYNSGGLPRPIRLGHATLRPPQSIVAWVAAGCPSRKAWESFDEPAPGKRR